MNGRDLILELLDLPLDATIEISIGGDEVGIAEVKTRYGFSDYIQIVIDDNRVELIDKTDLEELRDGFATLIEYARELEDVINSLNTELARLEEKNE